MPDIMDPKKKSFATKVTFLLEKQKAQRGAPVIGVDTIYVHAKYDHKYNDGTDVAYLKIQWRPDHTPQITKGEFRSTLVFPNGLKIEPPIVSWVYSYSLSIFGYPFEKLGEGLPPLGMQLDPADR